jgi:hypothetical protein
MTELFDISEQLPPWKVQAESRGIWTNYDQDNDYWTAQIDWFGGVEHAGGDTEREAVAVLTLQLKLDEKKSPE